MPEDPREAARRERLRNEGLWTNEDEMYYNEGEWRSRGNAVSRSCRRVMSRIYACGREETR